MGENEKDDRLEKRHYEGPPVFLEGRVPDLEASEAKRQKREDKHRTLQLWFNFLLVVVGAVTASVYLYQAHIMRQSLQLTARSADAAAGAARAAEQSVGIGKDSLKSSTEAIDKTLSAMREQIRAVKDGSDAAKRAAETAEKALTNSESFFEIANRPYVIAAGAKLINPLKIGEPIRIQIQLRNSGRTPAFGYKARLETAFMDTRKAIVFHTPNLEIPVPADIPADADRSLLFRSKVPLPLELSKAVGAGTHVLYVYGEFTYRSFSKEYNLTRFCFYTAAHK